jgi:hypothetical protein
MERCPVCGQMTWEYDYSRGRWACVCYDCASRYSGGESRPLTAERLQLESPRGPASAVQRSRQPRRDR